MDFRWFLAVESEVFNRAAISLLLVWPDRMNTTVSLSRCVNRAKRSGEIFIFDPSTIAIPQRLKTRLLPQLRRLHL